MELKNYHKPGYLAWANSKNHSELLASASLNDQSGLYSLDLLQVDLQERSKKIKVIGSAYTDIPFRCIAWDTYGQKQNVFPTGLIFTGMDDGSFRLWNPNQMINSYQPDYVPAFEALDAQTSIVYEEEAEEGGFPTMCCEWNSLKNNFLAFGGTDVLLLNVGKNPSQPQLIKPGKKNPHVNSYVTSVSWNREVAHILASASQNGLVALWDIKTNNSIFQFKDSAVSSGSRNVVICWSKSISTQIAVTLDDEKRNQLQIWDLRNQKGPVIVIDRLHTKGINAMDWCETDPQLILSASRDNKLACWNYTQEDAPLSQNNIDNGVFTVKWSKKLPSIYAVSNQEATTVYSLSDNLFGYVPKWYKVPVCSTFLGSHAALTYSQQRGPVLVESKLAGHQNQADPLRQELKALGNALQGVFDERQNDSEVSALIKAKLSSQADSGIYEYLGLSKQKIVKQVEQYTGKKRDYAIGTKSQKERVVKPKAKAYTQIQGQDALAFFAQIGNKPVQNKQEDQQNEGEVRYDMIPRNFNWDIGKERLVKQNILIGNYQGAIDAALKCGRTAQALIIAYSVDQNLFSTTLKTFFTQTTDNFITDFLKCIAYRDPLELINKYQLNKWKQCIAMIYSMSSKDKRPELLRLLAERLVNESEQGQQEQGQTLIPETYPPIICSILAEDFHHIADIYSNSLKAFPSGSLARKSAVIEYSRRLVSIYQGLTVEIPECKAYNRMLRQSMFVAIELGEKTIAHLICTKLSNNHRVLDYLVNTTPELEKYKSSVSFRPIILPVMQSKKTDKKTTKTNEHHQGHAPKPKKNIFPPQQREEEAHGRGHVPQPPPPGPPKRKQEEEQTSSGFSPYDNAPKSVPDRPQPPVKKNLNTPPPPPVSNKKVINQAYQNAPEEQPQQEREQPIVHKAPPTPVKKVQPPPPPPKHQTHDTSMSVDEESRGNVHRPAVKTPPPPPVARGPPNAPVRNQPPTPPMSRQETEESYQEEKHVPIPPPAKKKAPPPPSPANRVVPEQDRPVSETHVQPPPPVKRAPPQVSHPEIKRENPPPQSQPVRKVEEVQEQPQPRRNMPLPPPPKRGPPPPPRR